MPFVGGTRFVSFKGKPNGKPPVWAGIPYIKTHPVDFTNPANPFLTAMAVQLKKTRLLTKQGSKLVFCFDGEARLDMTFPVWGSQQRMNFESCDTEGKALKAFSNLKGTQQLGEQNAYARPLIYPDELDSLLLGPHRGGCTHERPCQ